jgi:mannosyl-3-phosphoglycerate phosphatase family protein
MQIVIFTDLDGSLLHPETYSFQEALPALELIRAKGIPLVLCSSKTRAEMELYRKRLNNADPFIVENGGGIFVPPGYFTNADGLVPHDGYLMAGLGYAYQDIRQTFEKLRKDLKVQVRGFGDMTVEEISRMTGLPTDEAALAKQRDFAEPFVFEHGVDERMLRAVEERGLRWTRGRFHHLMGDHDKGKAVRMLKGWFVNKYDKINTIGLGDGLNDLPMLKEVDYPILIAKATGEHDPGVVLPNLIKTASRGPQGWNQAVLSFLNQHKEHGG